MLTNKPFEKIEDISFKYLFDDRESEHNEEFYTYYLIEESVRKPSENTLLFKVANTKYNETWEIKLSYIDTTFKIVSNFLDEEGLSYEVECYSTKDKKILYKKLDDGEFYLHLDYEIEN